MKTMKGRTRTVTPSGNSGIARPGMSPAGDTSNAVLLIDKPEGKTSNETIREVERITGAGKIGHAGTLDRFASGLLVVCTGTATKLARYLLEDDKSYDRDGEARRQHRDRRQRGRRHRRAAGRRRDRRGDPGMRPEVHGRAAPAAAALLGPQDPGAARVGPGSERRAGGDPGAHHYGLRASTSATSIRTAAVSPSAARCSKGTYIRSLARDMGRELGTGAHLERLRRTAAGRFISRTP